MRWSFMEIVLGVVVASVIVTLVAYGVAILAFYALLQTLRP